MYAYMNLCISGCNIGLHQACAGIPAISDSEDDDSSDDGLAATAPAAAARKRSAAIGLQARARDKPYTPYWCDSCIASEELYRVGLPTRVLTCALCLHRHGGACV
jgi:hypothetical protein